MDTERTPAKARSTAGLGPLVPAAWDYYHKRLMGAPGETRHHIYWAADYVGRDGNLTGDLEWLLNAARAGKPHVEAPIWVRPMYYGDDVQRLLAAERERCAKLIEDYEAAGWHGSNGYHAGLKCAARLLRA